MTDFTKSNKQANYNTKSTPPLTVRQDRQRRQQSDKRKLCADGKSIICRCAALVKSKKKGQKKMKTENKKTYTTEEAIEAIRAYFEENESEYNNAIEELDSYNGYLGDNRYYDMDELNEFYSGQEPTEILYRAFYGYDEDHGGEFNPNREYFTYNGYGNLVSSDSKDYSSFLDDNFVSDYIENAAQLYDVPDEIQEIIDNIDDDTEGASND